MAHEKPRRTREEILREVAAAHQRCHALSDWLLANIKQHRPEIERVLGDFSREEPDLVYRFYHQSYKFFMMVDLTRRGVDLLRRLAPDSAGLKDWYTGIADEALSKQFDWNETNAKWLAETLPVLQGFWHSKYFLEQMVAAADELEAAPQILPSGWAAIPICTILGK